MISREELRQLAAFECDPPEFAVTFYVQPGTPKDKSHREEAILAKDLVRKTLQELEPGGRSRGLSADLERILHLAETLHGNGARSKVVFACNARDVWREYDLPPGALQTRIFVNRRFHLKTLASLFFEHPRYWIALVDRHSARFLEVDTENVRERGTLSISLPRYGRSDGYAGYNAGHVQRHSEDEIRRHFRAAAEVLKTAVGVRQCEALVIACHDVNWPDFQAQLHPDVRKCLLGRFSADLSSLADQKAKDEAERILHDSLQRRHQELIRETLEEARANGRGVTGLRRVLRATEMGEVETLIMTHDYSARAVECSGCRHVDSHLVSYCPVCGRATRALDDVCEALVPTAIRNNLELVLSPPNDMLDRVGNIAALLRFRADRNTNRIAGFISRNL